jgi:hypothetical protein
LTRRRGGAEKEAEKKRERQKIEGAESAEIPGLRSRIEEWFGGRMPLEKGHGSLKAALRKISGGKERRSG